MPEGNPERDLYLATQTKDEAAVKAILASSTKHDQLNYIDSVNGWTPLILSCINGLFSITRLILAAGANEDLVDFAGWTAKEHAVFRGHLNLARLFVSDEVHSARLKPQKRCLVDYQRQSLSSQIFVYLGPSHTRTNLAAINLDTEGPGDSRAAWKTNLSGVRIRAQGTGYETSHFIQFPTENMANRPVSFLTENLEKSILVFEICQCPVAQEKDIKVWGTGIALLQRLREGLAPNHESITRHFTIPLIQNGTMACIGSITFSVLVVTPFNAENAPTKPSSGFWQKSDSYTIVGHRGSGANSSTRNMLQIGENTYQSFLTAIDRGVSCVEFDVQLTKDYRPVIYHDFLVKEMGADVQLYELTFDQFQHLSRSQAPKSDRFGYGEQKYIEKTHPHKDGHPLKSRRHSLNEYDHSRSEDLLERIKYTEAGTRSSIEGNIRGCSIQEPSTTLEELLTSLPDNIDFDLEVKYPMHWEADDRAMEYVAIEFNTYVDTILTTIFRHYRSRNITLTSFSPEICIALACKQRTFPILMINKAGAVPAGDDRAGSLKGAIDFATAWDLDGIVVIADPFVMCPRLLTYAKDMGLVVASYGDLNNDPESVLIQIKAGLDAVITDKAHLLSRSLKQHHLSV